MEKLPLIKIQNRPARAGNWKTAYFSPDLA